MADTVFSLNPSDRRFERLGIRKASPEVQAVLSKLVDTGMQRPKTMSGNRALNTPDDNTLKHMADSTAAEVTDSESLFQILPDMELAMQIMVSSILSPKDMGNNIDLTYSVEAGSLETELVGAMIKVVEEYFDKTYKIKKLLTPILKDTLFMTGSYPLLILPENTIDEAINSPDRVSMESISGELDATGEPRPMGFLGQASEVTTTASLESFYSPNYHAPQAVDMAVAKSKIDLHLKVSDNPTLLKLPLLRDKVRQDRIHNMFSMAHRGMHSRISFESQLDAAKPGRRKVKPKPIGKSSADVEASLYLRRRYKNVPVVTLLTPEMMGTTPIGHPLVTKLPSESIIPVHVPSNPDEHLGYFVLVDELGNPIVKAKTADYYTDMTTNINSNRDMVSQLIASTKRDQLGRENDQRVQDDQLVTAYTDLVEEDLLNRLRNGIYGDDVEISRPTEVYRVMLARALARMNTRLLYVPAELVSYIAFDYNNLGIGCSLLAKSRILGSIRAITLFANSMAMMKNSTAREQLNIQLDPNDKDPSGTVEFLVHEYAKLRQASYPVGASNPTDIVRFIQSASVQIAVSGNTNYPETKFEVEDKASAKVQPNIDFMNELRDQHIMSVGLPPETVTAGANAEFATTIVQQNLLLSKRVLQYQLDFCEMLSDFIRKYVLHSGALMEALREVIRNNRASVKQAAKEEAEKAKAEAERIKKLKDGDQPPVDDQGDQPPADTDEGSETPPEGEEEEGQEDEGPGDQFGSLESIDDKPVDRSKNDEAKVITDKQRLSDDDDGVGDDAIIMEFLRSLNVSLPAPDNATMDNQLKGYTQYDEFLTVALKAYVDETYLNDTTLGQYGVKAETVIAVIKAYFLRQWLRKNGVLSELDVLANLGAKNESFDFLDIQSAHIEGLQISIGRFVADMEAKLKARGIPPGDAGGGFGGDTGGGGDGLGGDDFGDLGGEGGGETPPEGSPIGEEGAADADEITDANQETQADQEQAASATTEEEELDENGKPKPKSPAP